MVCGAFRRQEKGASQLHQPSAEQNTLPGPDARTLRAARTSRWQRLHAPAHERADFCAGGVLAVNPVMNDDNPEGMPYLEWKNQG